MKKIPETIKRVHDLAKESAKRGDLPVDAAYLHYDAQEDEWVICDNYERFCNTMLTCKAGVWRTRSMYGGDADGNEMTQEAAEANARLMFSDG